MAQSSQPYDPQKLFPHSKIVSFSNGRLTFLQDNLNKIIDYFNESSLAPKDIPVVALSIIGPPASGKSFLTNLLIEYFLGGGEGGWLLNLTKERGDEPTPTMTGFPWGSMESCRSPSIFYQTDDDLSTSGVYLWPQPFIMKTVGERELLVWILHLVKGNDNEPEEGLKTLERFLMLSCSRMGDITFGNELFNILEESMNYSHAQDDQFCNSIVFIFRTNNISHNKKKYTTDEEAKKQLSSMIKRKGASSALDRLRYINILDIKDTDQPLHDQNGCLNPDIEKNVKASLKRIIEVITDDSEIIPKTDGNNGEELRMEGFLNFLRSCADQSGSGMPFDVFDGNATPINFPDLNMRSNHPVTKDLQEETVTEQVEAKEKPMNRSRLSADQCRNLHEETDPIRKKPPQIGFEPAMSDITHGIGHMNGPTFLTQGDEPFGKFEVPPNLQMNISLYPNIMPSVSSIPSPYLGVENMEIDTDEEGEASRKLEEEVTKGREKVAGLKAAEEELARRKALEEEASRRKMVEEAAWRKVEEEKEARRKAAEEAKARKAQLEEQQKNKEALQKQKLIDYIKEVSSICKQQLRDKLHPATHNFIANHLTPKNISDINNIYSDIRNKLKQQGFFPAEKDFWPPIDREIDNECNDSFANYLAQVETRLSRFNNIMSKKITFNAYYPIQELNDLVRKEFQNVTNDLDPKSEIHALIKTGCLKLLTQFREDSTRFNTNDGLLAAKLLPDVRKFYNDEMEEMLKKDAYDKTKLTEIHDNLVTKLVHEFKLSFRCNENLPPIKLCESVENKLDELRSSLKVDFYTHSRNNDAKLKRLLKEISSCIQKAKSSYIEMLDKILDIHPDGIDTRVLQQKHDEILFGTRKLLEMDIRKKLPKDEPLQIHMTTLQAHVDKHWKYVLDENSEKKKRAAKREERERENRRKFMENEKRKLKEEEQRKSAKEEELRKSTQEKDRTQKPKTNNGTGQEDLKTGQTAKRVPQVLSPLVFQLHRKTVKMGTLTNEHPQILQNCFGETSTPLLMGVTNNGQFICGNEVERMGNPPMLRQHWDVADILSSSSSEKAEWTHLIRDNGSGHSHKITAEFLIGFILGRLKDGVEDGCKGICQEAVITVPFWISSKQRQILCDGARLADFSKVSIIEESYAGAYANISNANHSPAMATGYILIISQSQHDDMIEAFIYDFDFSTRVIKPVGSLGKPWPNESNKKGKNVFLDGLKYCYDQIRGGNAKHDQMVKIAKATCQEAKDRLKNLQAYQHPSVGNPSIYIKLFVMSASSEWSSIFNKVGKDTGMSVSEGIHGDAVFLQAVHMCKYPSIYANYNVKSVHYSDAINFAKLKSLLEQVINPQKKINELNELKDAREQLRNKCNEIKGQIGLVYNFKSDVARDMFTKKIDDAHKLANDSASTLAQIDVQLAILVTWSSKHIK